MGLFNVVYGAMGLMAALYLARMDAVLLCVWVMALGIVLRSTFPSRAWRRLSRPLRGPSGS